MAVILASASPRRRELLKYAVRDFTVIPAAADEALPDGIAAREAPEHLARIKAAAVAREHEFDTVIGCDTVVILDGEIMGKPKNINHARSMLKKLSGRTHSVITGVCVRRRERELSFSECTEVTFYELTDKQIDDYVLTGDPMDKAGAYGIQSEGCVLVKEICGDFFNVVGLPVARLFRVLEDFGK